MQIIYQASLVWNIFTRDSRKVLDILKELTLGTDAETWIEGLKQNRKAIQELQAHYARKLEGAQRKQVARADLKKIFYKNETNFTFEKYVTKLKGIFNVLKKNWCCTIQGEDSRASNRPDYFTNHIVEDISKHM